MTVEPESADSLQAQQQARVAVEAEKALLLVHLEENLQLMAQLGSEQGRVEEQARGMEPEIRELVQEEQALNAKKRSMQDRAKELAVQRSSISGRRVQLARDKEILQSKLIKLQSRLEQIHRCVESLPMADAIEPIDVSSLRNSVRVPVEVLVAVTNPPMAFTTVTVNLSDGGLFLATFENIPVGTIIDLILFLPDQPGMQLKGEVRWACSGNNPMAPDATPGLGVKFIALSAQENALIRTFRQSYLSPE